jgi:glycosyltransferase involved in cell wall biosynthesis
VVLSLDVGGLERIVLGLVREGRKLGQKISVICLTARGALASEAEALGARVICVDKPPGLRPSVIPKLKLLLDELSPDVVHTHQIGALFYAGPAARSAGTPVIVHSEHGKHYAGRLRTRIMGRMASRRAARFFCVSRDIEVEVHKYRIADASKTAVVHNGIDVDLFDVPPDDVLRAGLGILPGAQVIGTIGRLNEVKRQDVLLRAFAEVARSVRGVQLLLVGEGPMRAELERLAADLGVATATHFVGYQSKPERYLPLLDVFAITSRSEGMPLAVLEAWAARVPVVASAVGGLPEMIEHGRTGLLFPAGDHAALSQLLQSALGDSKQTRDLREAGLARVRSSFSLERMAGEYQRHYVELLGLRKGRSNLS